MLDMYIIVMVGDDYGFMNNTESLVLHLLTVVGAKDEIRIE